MASDDLLHRVSDGIARVTFNRPAARNAMTFAMYERLAAICNAIGGDRAVRVLVLTGAGGEAFSSGTDIAQFRDFKTADDAIQYEQMLDRVVAAVAACGKPTIAAIAGACAGGAAAIASACDLRIAAANMRFGFPIARTLGNCLSLANIGRLAALIGPARVKDIIFTARLIAAEEARAIGLVNEVLPDADALTQRATALATLLAGHAPLTLRATKEALARVAAGAGEDAGDDLVRLCYMSQDFREGMTAFLEKRAPHFKGE